MHCVKYNGQVLLNILILCVELTGSWIWEAPLASFGGRHLALVFYLKLDDFVKSA